MERYLHRYLHFCLNWRQQRESNINCKGEFKLIFKQILLSSHINVGFFPPKITFSGCVNLYLPIDGVEQSLIFLLCLVDPAEKKVKAQSWQL